MRGQWEALTKKWLICIVFYASSISWFNKSATEGSNCRTEYCEAWKCRDDSEDRRWKKRKVGDTEILHIKWE